MYGKRGGGCFRDHSLVCHRLNLGQGNLFFFTPQSDANFKFLSFLGVNSGNTKVQSRTPPVKNKPTQTAGCQIYHMPKESRAGRSWSSRYCVTHFIPEDSTICCAIHSCDINMFFCDLGFNQTKPIEQSFGVTGCETVNPKPD